MRSVVSHMLVLGIVIVGCGGGEERRPARTPVSTTRTTSAALTVSSAPATSNASTNATMAPAATPPAAPVRPARVETASAVMRVAVSRCDREVACNNVGTGREFGDRDECVNEVGHYVVTAIPSDECPDGVDADALSTCIRDAKAEPCEIGGGGAEVVDRLTSCSRDRLCASPF